jgi:CRP/FNR family transcriptional regulator, anaerobic regulatory protein
MLTELFVKFNAIYPMTERLQQKLQAAFEISEIPENSFLLKEGNINSNVNVVLKGITKSYYIDNNGKEICTRIMTDNHIVVSVTSFFTQQPSYENIVTLSPCVIAKISFETLQKLYKEFLELNYIIRNVTEFYFLQSEQRIRLLRLGSAEEKYLFFIENYPNLFNKVPLHTIASFLNIAPETLSRVRHKLAFRDK